jgi:hypothetical protein
MAMLRWIVAFVFGAAMAFAPMAHNSVAFAQSGCPSWGCNIVDDGEFNSSLIGKTVYVNGNRRQVTGINTYARTVTYVAPDGRYYTVQATEVYSQRRQNERTATGVAVVGGILCVFFCPRGNTQQSGNSGGSTNSNALNSCLNRCYNQGDPDPVRESALRQGCRNDCYANYR